MGTNKEREIADAFSLIAFPNDKIEFLKNYKKYLEIVSSDPKNLLTYSNIVTSYCLAQIEDKILTNTKEAKKINFGFKRFKKSMNRFVESYNEKPKKKKLHVEFKQLKKDNGFLAFFSHLRVSNIQQIRKSKINEKDIQEYFCLYISKNLNKCYFYKGSKWLINLLSWWLMSKLRIKFIDHSIKEYKKEDLNNFLTDKEIKIYELGLNNTELGISDKVIIKSRKGEGIKYYNKLKESSILPKKGISIYDLDYISFSYKNNKKLKLNFLRKKGHMIQLELPSHFKEEIPPAIKILLGERILLFDKIDEKIFIKRFIHRQYLDKYDIANPFIKPIIEKLKGIKLISITPNYKYFCTDPKCPYLLDRRFLPSPLCPCGKLSTQKFISHYDIKIEYENLSKLIGRNLKDNGFDSYKNMPKNYLEFKNSPILRLEKDKQYLYVLINKEGLSDEDVELLKTNGIPLLIINLKGEITSTFKEFESVDSGELVYSVINKDYSLLKKVLTDVEKNIFSLKLESFEQAIKNLSKENLTPSLFEKSVFAIFNLMFNNCQRWGGPNLADGSFPLPANRINYLIWDAKRYTISSLLDYVDKKSLKKDIKYMEKFNENKIIQDFGSIKFYLFVTSNTQKSEFMGMKDSIKKQIKQTRTEKKLKGVQVLCMDKESLLKLANFFKEHKEKLFEKRDQFSKIIKQGLKLNDGYFDFELIKLNLEELLKEDKIYPLPKELRK